MRQSTFSSGFEKHSKKTRKERFLEEMDQVIPWKDLSKALEPHYPNPHGASPPADWPGTDAAHLFHAALAPPVGPGDGRRVVRFARDVRFRAN